MSPMQRGNSRKYAAGHGGAGPGLSVQALGAGAGPRRAGGGAGAGPAGLRGAWRAAVPVSPRGNAPAAEPTETTPLPRREQRRDDAWHHDPDARLRQAQGERARGLGLGLRLRVPAPCRAGRLRGIYTADANRTPAGAFCPQLRPSSASGMFNERQRGREGPEPRGTPDWPPASDWAPLGLGFSVCQVGILAPRALSSCVNLGSGLDLPEPQL